jgi:hypothetical protein
VATVVRVATEAEAEALALTELLLVALVALVVTA